MLQLAGLPQADASVRAARQDVAAAEHQQALDWAAVLQGRLKGAPLPDLHSAAQHTRQELLLSPAAPSHQVAKASDGRRPAGWSPHLSTEAEMMVLAGPSATALTWYLWPSSLCMGAPASTFHTRTEVSLEPECTVLDVAGGPHQPVIRNSHHGLACRHDIADAVAGGRSANQGYVCL